MSTHSDSYTFYRRLADYLRHNEIEDIVQLKTNLEYDEVQQEYRAHDIFILPSERKAAAVSPIEAMGAGLSIVSSHDNGTRWSIKPTENGYIFQCGNMGVLTELLDNIMGSPEGAEAFGLRSIELAEKNHSSDAFYATLSTIVTDHLSG